MRAHYITGIAGSGKTTIRNELVRRGHIARDTDDFGQWMNTVSNIPVERLSTSCGPEWHELHKWILPPDKIKSVLAYYAYKEAVYLCGTSSNDNEITPLFDRVICITIDPDTLVRRLRYRENSDFGKSAQEFNVVANWHQTLEEYHRRNGAVMIDGQQSVQDIVDEIVAVTPSHIQTSNTFN